MTSESATSPTIPTPMSQNPIKSEPISAVPPSPARATMEDIVNRNEVIANQVTDEVKEPSYYKNLDSEEYAAKYRRYESDFKQYLMANYFSGEDIYEERTTIDGETIMSSKWPFTHTYVDPDVLQGLHESEVDHCELTRMVAIDPTALSNKEPERFTFSDSKKRKAESDSRSVKRTKDESVVRQTLTGEDEVENNNQILQYNSDTDNVDDRRAKAEWVASFTRPGIKKVALDELDEEICERYLSFADSFVKAVAAENDIIAYYEKQLQTQPSSEELEEQKRQVAELTAQVEELRAKEAESTKSVKQAKFSSLQAEKIALETAVREHRSKLEESEVQINSLMASVAELNTRSEVAEAKLLEMTKCRDKDVKKAAQAARREEAAKYKSVFEQVKAHMKAKDAAFEVKYIIAQQMANLELLKEITDGKITDFEAEEMIVARDKRESEVELAGIQIHVLDWEKLGFPQLSEERAGDGEEGRAELEL